MEDRKKVDTMMKRKNEKKVKYWEKKERGKISANNKKGKNK